MAKFYFIVALMILQGLPFSYATLSEGICPTPTTVTSTPSSSVVIKPGPKVYLNLIVTTNCSGENLQALNDSLQIDIKAVYTCAGFPIKTVKTLSISCNSSLSITLDLWFCSGLPANKTIEEVFQDALNNGNISSLTESNTNYTFTFVGETTTTLTVCPTVTEGSTAVTTGEATPTVGGTAVTTAAGMTTTTVTGGISPTPTTVTSTPSSSVVIKPGPKVSLTLIVTTDCSGENLQALNVSLQIDIKTVYTNAKFPIKTVTTRSISCNSLLNITLDLSFYSGLPSEKTIKKVFQEALKNEDINSLTESNTKYTFKFDGVTLKYSPKDGECKTVCCDGGGGELTVELVCTPAENTCEGFETDEKKEDGHCPGDSKNTCPDTCGGIYHSPSFAVVILLAIVTFTKTVFF